MEKRKIANILEYQSESPISYEVGGILFLVEPVYREDGESMEDLLHKLLKREVDNAH